MARLDGKLTFKCACKQEFAISINGELPIVIHCNQCGKYYKVGFLFTEVELVQVGLSGGG